MNQQSTEICLGRDKIYCSASHFKFGSDIYCPVCFFGHVHTSSKIQNLKFLLWLYQGIPSRDNKQDFHRRPCANTHTKCIQIVNRKSINIKVHINIVVYSWNETKTLGRRIIYCYMQLNAWGIYMVNAWDAGAVPEPFIIYIMWSSRDQGTHVYSEGEQNSC